MVYRSHQDELSDTDNPLNQFGPEEEARMEQNARQGLGGSGYSSDMARRVRGAENAAAAGKPNLNGGGGNARQAGKISSGNSPSLNNKLNNFGNNVRDKLKDKEGSGLYKPTAKDDDSSSSNNESPFKKFGGMRRRLAVAGLISGLVGGGGGFAVFGIVSGPLQIMQLGELLSAFHLQEKEDQGDSRTTKLLRNVRYAVRGEYQKTRVGMIGNHIADKVENKMKERGFAIEYDTSGKFTGYRIDPSKLSSADYPGLDTNDQAAVKDYFENKLGATVSADGNTLRVEPKGGYFGEKRLFKGVLRASGFKSSSWLATRFSGVRMNFGFHWFKVLSGQTLDEKYRAWQKRMYDKIKGKVKVPTATAERKDRDGNTISDESTQTVQEVQDATNQANEDLSNGKPDAKAKVADLLKGKLGGGLAGIVGVLCFIDAIAKNVDKLNYLNIIQPAAIMGMQAVSLSSQIQDNRDVDERQMGWISQLLNDKAAGNWSSARSIQAESGHALSGEDASPDMRIDPQGNMAVKIATALGLDALCGVLEGTVGIVLTVAIGLFAPVATGIGLVLSQLFGPAVIDLLSNMFTADAIDPFAKGAKRGNILNYGARWAANDVSVSRGGLPLTNSDEQLIASATRSSIQQDFNDQNLAYRLFSPEDPKSFISQVIQTQSTDPAQNASNVAMGVLNMGSTFSSTIGNIFSRAVGAAPATAYNYGFPDYAFAPSEMNAPEFDNPYENANNAADILDANSAAEQPTDANNQPNNNNYIVRAKTCFGITVEKKPVPIEGQTDPVQQYVIHSPTQDDVPLAKDVVDPAHKCIDGSPYGAQVGGGLTGGINDWTRIRMFLFDSQMANAAGCLNGGEDDAIAKQACIDIGIEPDPNGGSGTSAWDSSTGVPTCATTAVSSAPAGYTLSSCDDFEGTSLDGSTFTAYTSGGGDTVSGAGRKAEQCTVANSFFTLTQGADGATCGSASSFGQKEGYWEVRMRAKAIDGGKSSAHPVLILWPDSDVWADGELDYFETNIGEDGGGFLHCVGNPSKNCYTIASDPGGNPGLTPNAAKYADWLSYGLMWKPDSMTGYINGQQWWTSSDGSFRPNVSMHQTIQLDNLSGEDNPNPAQMQVDWVHVYCQTGVADCKAATTAPKAAP